MQVLSPSTFKQMCTGIDTCLKCIDYVPGAKHGTRAMVIRPFLGILIMLLIAIVYLQY